MPQVVDTLATAQLVAERCAAGIIGEVAAPVEFLSVLDSVSEAMAIDRFQNGWFYFGGHLLMEVLNLIVVQNTTLPYLYCS